jgi:hypothetical protein
VDNLGTTNAATIGDRVVRFDTANPAGSIVTVGATGVASTLMSGLDFAPNGTLYAVSQPTNGGGNLFTINQSTGAATSVGLLGLPTGTTAGFQLTDLSYNPLSGQMLGLGVSLFTTPARVHRLYSINLATGAATNLGDVTGLPATALDVGMASSSLGINYLHNIGDDRMYQMAGLVAAPMAATIGVDTNFSQGMTINWGGANEWYMNALGSVPAFFSDIRQMNLVTGGTSAVLGTFPIHASNGLPEYEMGDLAIPPVPEPASLGLVAAVGLLAARRRTH